MPKTRSKSTKPRAPNQRRVWDSIASGWSDWRVKPRHEVEMFAHDWLPPSRVLDIGCGNGRNLAQFSARGFDCYGIDFSKKMIAEAEKGFKRNSLRAKFKVADAREIPYHSGSFEHCLFVATLHHLKREKDRTTALKELKRVLKPGGTAIVSVWNKYSFGHPHLALRPKETYIVWKRKGKEHLRYYHLFDHWELKRLIEDSGLTILKSGGAFDDNIVFLVGKSRSDGMSRSHGLAEHQS